MWLIKVWKRQKEGWRCSQKKRKKRCYCNLRGVRDHKELRIVKIKRVGRDGAGSKFVDDI